MSRSTSNAILLAAVALAAALPLPGAWARQRDDFDHFQTGFPLTGAHERVACESCHARGVFQGTPTRCGDCHSGSGVIAAGGKSTGHVLSSNECSDCHVTASWSAARFDHRAVIGSCARCHNGATATGMPPNHLRTNAGCDQCHGTLAWTPARFDHSSVTGSCFSCHNGTTATGKHARHVPSSNTCEDCHTTRSWNVARFDHSGITTGCFGCHNGTTATGKHPGHISSSNTCEDCHTTVSWLGASFDHSRVTGSCAGCHNGVTATGMDSGHFVTSLGCETCHGTQAWLPHTFRHSSPSYPGDHRRNLQCQDCHLGNSQTVAWKFGAYRPDCAGCHADDFKPDEHKKLDTPKILYTAGDLRDCTGACHEYTDSSFTTIRERRSGEHRVTSSDW